MSKIIPILPCVSIDEQCAFYEALGFATTAKYRSPNAYVCVEFEDIALHFWGSRKNEPSANASMVFIHIADADALNGRFSTNLKTALGKIPRSGMPRISKVRALQDDRRFTVCDPGGNTLYFATPTSGAVSARTLESVEHAKAFAVVYDLLHSHENAEKAVKSLAAFMRRYDELGGADKAKVDALAGEIEEASKPS
jgi:hypothetical protein